MSIDKVNHDQSGFGTLAIRLSGIIKNVTSLLIKRVSHFEYMLLF